jgi:anti-sigma-K factor RskA
VSDNAHLDLGGYLLGKLSPEERESFERHLAACDDCRLTLAELEPVASSLESPPPTWQLPAELEARTLAAIEREAASVSKPTGQRALRPALPRMPRLALAGLAAAALAAAFALGALTSGGDGDRASDHAHRPDGDRLPILLAAADGGRPHSHAEIERTGEGVSVLFHSDFLPVLPLGERYELWLVGRGDSPAQPNRISAGTFVPNAKGTTYVDLSAAADPDAYRVLSITRERIDGDPSPTLPDVVRSDWARR